MGANTYENVRLGAKFKRSSPASLGDVINVTRYLEGDEPQTAAKFTTPFFIADAPCELIAVAERHEVAGSDGSAVTVMVKKVPSATAPASGSDMLSAGVSLKGAANTNLAGALHATIANRQLGEGDALALVLTGTPTSLIGVTVRCRLRYL